VQDIIEMFDSFNRNLKKSRNTDESLVKRRMTLAIQDLHLLKKELGYQQMETKKILGKEES